MGYVKNSIVVPRAGFGFGSRPPIGGLSLTTASRPSQLGTSSGVQIRTRANKLTRSSRSALAFATSEFRANEVGAPSHLLNISTQMHSKKRPRFSSNLFSFPQTLFYQFHL